MYLDRLKLIQDRCIGSPFFSSHELIGSSLLFVHDDTKVTKNFTNICKPFLVSERPIDWESSSHNLTIT